MPKTVKVHVTFDETKRVLSHQKGADVEGLRPVFLQVFSDVLSSDIAPAQVKFQLYDDHFDDYVELSNAKRLDEDIKIRALVTKQAKQVFLVTLAVIFNIFNAGSECPRGLSVYVIWGLFLETPGNFTGPKSNFEIKVWRKAGCSDL